MKCAAFELPFKTDEIFGTINVQEILSILSEEGFVHLTDGQWQWTQDSYPADAVSLLDALFASDPTWREHRFCGG